MTGILKYKAAESAASQLPTEEVGAQSLCMYHSVPRLLAGYTRLLSAASYFNMPVSAEKSNWLCLLITTAICGRLLQVHLYSMFLFCLGFAALLQNR